MRFRNAAVAIAAASVLFAGSVGVPANASDAEDPTLAALTELSETATSPEQAVLDDLHSAGEASGDNALSVETASGETTVPVDPADGVVIGDEVTFELGLPFADQADTAEELTTGIVAYDNNNGSTTVPLIKGDGSVQVATVIDGPASPTRYDYTLDVPAGGSVSLDESGIVQVLDAGGAFVAGITAPWATDAEGGAVPTRYELSGSTLTQVVDHSAAYAYPVVADPWLGQNLLVRASVTQRIGYHIVNATATAWGRAYNGPATHAAHVAELKTRLGPNHQAKVDANGGTIREQFLCHVAGNYFEQGEYNMESYRPAKHWALQLNPIDRCNPA